MKVTGAARLKPQRLALTSKRSSSKCYKSSSSQLKLWERERCKAKRNSIKPRRGPRNKKMI